MPFLGDQDKAEIHDKCIMDDFNVVLTWLKALTLRIISSSRKHKQSADT